MFQINVSKQILYKIHITIKGSKIFSHYYYNWFKVYGNSPDKLMVIVSPDGMEMQSKVINETDVSVQTISRGTIFFLNDLNFFRHLLYWNPRSYLDAFSIFTSETPVETAAIEYPEERAIQTSLHCGTDRYQPATFQLVGKGTSEFYDSALC